MSLTDVSLYATIKNDLLITIHHLDRSLELAIIGSKVSGLRAQNSLYLCLRRILLPSEFLKEVSIKPKSRIFARPQFCMSTSDPLEYHFLHFGKAKEK